MENQTPVLSVSQFVDITNQVFDTAYPSVEIVGEVASFKVNQGKFVFFDLKDDESSVGCFMMVFNLRMPIEDGMKVIVRASPKLTKWGKFSLTVQQIRPVGEGNLKKSFELLLAKLQKEGLFSEERKRPLPARPQRIAVISSTGAAGYADFMNIIDARWGGMEVDVAHTQVQGDVAADQMIRALKYINEMETLPEVIVMIRGGGSADDLASYNDEMLVRAVAASRVPVLSGIGHETDQSLVDLAADVMALTPSNAAERLVPEKREVIRQVRQSLRYLVQQTSAAVDGLESERSMQLARMLEVLELKSEVTERELKGIRSTLSAYDPLRVLERGYAIMRGTAKKGAVVEIETTKEYISAEVQDVRQK